MFGIGGSEILVILVIALLFLGPDKLPDAAKKISKGIRDLKKQGRILTQTIENDETIGGALRDIKSALRGDEIPARPVVKKPIHKIEGDGQPKLAAGDHKSQAVGAVADAIDNAAAEIAARDKALHEADAGATDIINNAAATKSPTEADLIAARDRALHEADVAERALQAAQQAKLTLPRTAGEPNADAPDLRGTHDASALAALIKPPVGEPIKREEPASDDEPKLKHG